MFVHEIDVRFERGLLPVCTGLQRHICVSASDIMATRLVLTRMELLRLAVLMLYRVKLFQELHDGGHAFRVESVDVLHLKRDTDAACFGMNTEGRLEQVVPVLRHFCIKPGVGV